MINQPPLKKLSTDLSHWEDTWRKLVCTQQPSLDPAHDLLHFERVVASAKWLAALENANYEIVVPAAWLHDWVAIPKNDPRRSQASRLSSEAVQKLLTQMNYPDELIPAIGHAIESHSFSAGIETRTLEAQVVQDADRLDALGAIGIARCFSTAGTLGTPFYSLEDSFCKRREPDDAHFALDHFYKKLLKLPSTFKTESGRIEAQRRVTFMMGYLAQLEQEIHRSSESSKYT